MGYRDGMFGPGRSMTRAEVSAIFARLLAAKRGDAIPAAAGTKFVDIPSGAWYSGYVKYLADYGVAYGRIKDHFAPNEAITRAEFVAMTVRFFNVYGDGSQEIMERYKDFNDVNDGYWAAAYIKAAAKYGWVTGYTDGTFRGDTARSTVPRWSPSSTACWAGRRTRITSQTISTGSTPSRM